VVGSDGLIFTEVIVNPAARDNNDPASRTAVNAGRSFISRKQDNYLRVEDETKLPPDYYSSTMDQRGNLKTAHERYGTSSSEVVGCCEEELDNKTSELVAQLLELNNASNFLTKRRRCINMVKKFLAFLFSTIGLCCLLVGYTILGGVIFRSIEGPYELLIKNDIQMTIK